jgi:hypothetical protein
MKAKGIYIYGIVPNFYGTDHFRTLERTGVYAITFQNISAIVSDTETIQLDFLDRESLAHTLVHHQKTIETLLGNGFRMILPMKLGTIMHEKEEVYEMLSRGHDLIINTLKKVENLTEMDLAVTWADLGSTLRELANSPEIVEMKEKLTENGTIISQSQQVTIGIMLKEKLVKKNKDIELQLLDSFASCTNDIKLHEVMNDQMITNAAILLKSGNVSHFEQIIEKVDNEFNGTLNFKIVGPLPCYSFFTVEVKLLNPVKIENAKITLGLTTETNETEIKKAYLKKAGMSHPDKIEEGASDDEFNKITHAYQVLMEYAQASRQTMGEMHIDLGKEHILNNLILVKIKE